MRENELAILDQYDIDVKNTRKVRDAVLCEASQGLFLVKELIVSEKRLSVLEYLGEYLRARGCENVDRILKNKDNQLFSVSEEGNRYFLKKWFPGRECDIRKEKDVLDAVANLTKLHLALRDFEISAGCDGALEETKQQCVKIAQGEDLREEFFRHNREMKKVRTFMRERVRKGDFEISFLKYFETMYSYADQATELLQASDYGVMLEEARNHHHLVHGDYNYHNILMTPTGIATTNFEHIHEDVQVSDFYYFLRKVMEKNHWDPVLGDKMIRSYQRYIPLQDEDLQYVAICLAYPEKFWKAANSYYRSKKVWIPAKNLEKLDLVIRQTEEKKEFLKTIFAFQL